MGELVIVKRILMWIGGIAFVIGIIINMSSSDEEEVKKEEAMAEVDKKETIEETEKKEESEEQTDEPIVIEVDESIESVDYTAKVQRVKIDDDILTVVFDWENQSDWDPAHFPLLGYVTVEQNGEVLEQAGDLDRQNKQIKHGSFDVYDLEYNLIDDSDVTIRIVSTNEHDGSEGKIKVSLE